MIKNLAGMDKTRNINKKSRDLFLPILENFVDLFERQRHIQANKKRWFIDCIRLRTANYLDIMLIVNAYYFW